MRQAIVGGLVAGLMAGLVVVAGLAFLIPQAQARAQDGGAQPVTIANDLPLNVNIAGAAEGLTVPVEIEQLRDFATGRLLDPITVTVSNETAGAFPQPVPLVVSVAGGTSGGPVQAQHVIVDGPVYTLSCDKRYYAGSC